MEEKKDKVVKISAEVHAKLVEFCAYEHGRYSHRKKEWGKSYKNVVGKAIEEYITREKK